MIEAFCKRTFDASGALVGLLLTFWLIALTWLFATLDTRKIGANGRNAALKCHEYGNLAKQLDRVL